MKKLIERISEENRNRLVLDANDKILVAQSALETLESKHYYTDLTIGEVLSISYALSIGFEIEEIINLFEP